MATPGRRWLGPALRRQSRAATALMAGFCLAALLGVPFGLGVQVGVLLAGIVVVGVPHGAFGVVQNRVTREAGLALSGRMMAPCRFQVWWAHGSVCWRSGAAARG